MRDPGFKLPRLYPIIDVSCFNQVDVTAAVLRHAQEIVGGGATFLQYRNKIGSAREMLCHARDLRHTLNGSARLMMNDRADLCIAAEFDGVHLGQDDLSPASARALLGDRFIVGFSTHNPLQVREADTLPVNYIAIGPVFATASKANPDPVIGLEGVRMARSLTSKPLVAIGGITRANCRSVIEAGADSVAVIGDLLGDPRAAVEEFLSILA